MKIEIDQFNSDIFHMRMGNVLGICGGTSDGSVVSLIKEAKELGFRHLNAKIETSDIKTVNSFIRNGFELVDTQLMYCLDSFLRWGVHQTQFIYREFERSDLKQVVSIARKAYYLDQYHSDTFLDNSLCDQYYAEWVKNSCNGFADKVMVAETPDAVIAGYITLNYKEEDVIVGLAAVDERYRGLGCFTKIISETLRLINQEGKRKLYYGTQLSNIPVLKTMGKFNGYVINSKYVMHHLIEME